MTLRKTGDLDHTDRSILRELQGDARLSYKELGQRVGLSAPAVIERVRKLEESGVIVGYRAEVDPARLGLPVMAYIRMRCFGDRCLRLSLEDADFPEIVELHRVSGGDCSILKVLVASVEHLESVIDRLSHYGASETALVLSSPIQRRVVDCDATP
jgi:Lrp/AsnC family leucine-responsive transcriptional regulator